MSKVVVALDNLNIEQIQALVKSFAKEKVIFKINDAYVQYGVSLIEMLRSNGFEVFLDLKFHDIPNTVANYMKAIAKMGVFMVNVHCSGGFEMMQTAAQTLKSYCEEHKCRKPLLLGVTILTSLNTADLIDMGIIRSTNEAVHNLARMAKKAGLDGVVCSPQEIELVKRACGREFLTVTPGIRPVWSEKNDQQRITTPRDAVKKGTEYIVVGRPIVQASQFNMTPLEALKRIEEEMK